MAVGTRRLMAGHASNRDSLGTELRDGGIAKVTENGMVVSYRLK